MDRNTMIRKRLTISVVVAVLILSVVGVGAVTTGVLADSEADGNDSRENATEMATNSTETGTIEANDTDWYAFNASAGERIWVQLDVGADDSVLPENTSARFDIFGPSGNNVNGHPHDAMGPAYSPNAGASTEAVGGTIAEQSGTYYVRVEGQNISDYNLTVETQRLDQYDPNEQPATATPIESGEMVDAVMSGSDIDTYATDLDEGETISVTANDVDSNLVNTHLVGPNASNATLDGSNTEYVVTDEWPSANQFNHTANETGTYFIRVYPYEEGIGSYNMEDSYELSVSVSGADDDESPDEEASTDEDDSTGDDGTTETPDETEQPDSDESADDGESTVDETTDDTEQSDSEEAVDETGDDADSSEQSEC